MNGDSCRGWFRQTRVHHLWRVLFPMCPPLSRIMKGSCGEAMREINHAVKCFQTVLMCGSSLCRRTQSLTIPRTSVIAVNPEAMKVVCEFIILQACCRLFLFSIVRSQGLVGCLRTPPPTTLGASTTTHASHTTTVRRLSPSTEHPPPLTNQRTTNTRSSTSDKRHSPVNEPTHTHTPRTVVHVL